MNPKEAVAPVRPQNGEPARGDYATRWKQGGSGRRLSDVTREKLEAIVDKLIAMALGGDHAAIRELLERCAGKPRQTIDIENAALRESRGSVVRLVRL